MEGRTFENNDEAVQAWNGVLFDKFCRFRDILTAGFAAHGNALLERFPVRPGTRVVDIGCGFGDTTLAIAAELAAGGAGGGEAVGVDAAERFIESARLDGDRTGAHNVRFFTADVQGDPLGGPYDRAFSRFGTMFFASPVAAFRNVRRSLGRGGLLTMVVWRRKDENPMFFEAEQRVLEIVKPPEVTDQPTCGPGPFSMASPDVVSAQLKAAGYTRISFERLDVEARVGKNVDEAVDFMMTMGPAGEVLRLAGAEAERHRPEVVESLRELFAPKLRPEGVIAASSSWLVSARA